MLLLGKLFVKRIKQPTTFVGIILLFHFFFSHSFIFPEDIFNHYPIVFAGFYLIIIDEDIIKR